MKALIFILLAMPIAGVAQTMHKCKNADGTSAYQQRPCSADQKTSGVAYVAPVEDSGRSWDDQYGDRVKQVEQQRREAAQAEQRAAAEAAHFAAEAPPREPTTDTPPAPNRTPRAGLPPNRPFAAGVVRDQFGNEYDRPEGSHFVIDRRTGKQCLAVDGATIKCD